MSQRTGTIIATAAGAVRGTAANGVRTFLGIPYAAPPTGLNRFALPRPHAPWPEVRDATIAGPTPPQRVKAFPGLDIVPLIGTGWIEGDDYLAANIWAPDTDATGLPVMVFVHGGAFVLGHKDVAVHDGSAFARDGVICVAINYRLGVEGFLPIPGVPTNLGLRDILFALEWVKQTIPAFGGNPDNITLFGESAGAMAIADLVGSPLAKGLFRRAVIQSGHGGMVRSIGIARKLVGRLARILKVPATEEGFRRTTAAKCLDAMEAMQPPKGKIDLRDSDGLEPSYGLTRFLPVYGDDVVPVKPIAGLAAGAGAEIDVLIGTNAEEMNLYWVPTGIKAKLGRLLAWFILSRVQPKARAVLKVYGFKDKSKSGGEVFTDATTDLVFRWPARRFAEEHRGRTHMYQFGWRSPAFGGQLGACHGLELPFVFDTLDTVTGPQGLVGPERPPQALADSVHRIWVDYARDGSLPWPEFKSETRLVYELAEGHAQYEQPMFAAPFLD